MRQILQQVRNGYAVGLEVRGLVAVLCVLLLVPGEYRNLRAQAQPAAAQPQTTSQPQATSQTQPGTQAPAVKLTNDQLDSLIAPIALYPDPLLSQTLVASTYPLEIVQLQQWLQKNSKLKDKELAEAVKKEDWDPSIQAMAALPDVVKRLADDIQWTNDLGNAFLAQQDDVMAAAQRMRKKASDTGNLKSSPEQKVETKVVENKTVIVVEQTNPQVVYVPTYNPTVVYGPPVYPYPPIYYPPPGYYAAGMAISFGVGVAMGAMWGGGWGYGCGWHGGGNNVYINHDNNFVRNSNTNINRNINNNQNINRSGNTNRSGNSNWQHNPQHRGGAPYSDRATADKFGGTARDSAGTRQSGARSGGGAQAGTMDRGTGGFNANRGGGGGGVQPGTLDRGGGGGVQPGTLDRSGGGSFGGDRGGGGDRVGNRSVSPSSSSSSRGAFGGSSGGMSGSSARASSQRGSSSMGSSRSGGFSGGGRGGGGRGGGRRR